MSVSCKSRLCSVSLLVATGFAGFGFTQDKPADQPATAAAVKVEGKSAKPVRRLPVYMSGIVNEKQRQEIYTIQSSFEGRLEALKEQMRSLVAERDQAIDAVLTKEQLAEVNAKREAAKKSRAEKTKAAAAETETSESK